MELENFTHERTSYASITRCSTPIGSAEPSPKKLCFEEHFPGMSKELPPFSGDEMEKPRVLKKATQVRNSGIFDKKRISPKNKKIL